MNPRIRLRFAWALLAASVAGWPLSALTFARHEPQTVLGLSWFALIEGSLAILLTADVRKTQDEDGEGDGEG